MHGARSTNFILQEADLLIVLGARFDDRAIGKTEQFCPNAKIILTAGVTLSLAHTNTVTLFGLTLICAGFSVGFGVAMSQALGPFS
ncbi:hypothetical protein MJL81_30830, partial [Salmonella enterica subsp. enterica serovar Anatum]|nr:hypothetical protein [Salmonella enterica subsp. enterica serovar Anatum]